MPARPTSSSRPTWLRQRAIGKRAGKLATSLEMMQRLQLEAALPGHSGAVNCLEWNACGNLLASGSTTTGPTDTSVILWHAYRQRKSLVKTGHQGNIYSIKFMADHSTLATCASDRAVKLTHVASGKNLLNCLECHRDRVKRLATHPQQPNLIWSAGEDGCIMQYDTRQPHVCCDTRPRNLLIDLKSISGHLVAKCLAVNPVRDEQLAVGSNDVYCRLFDRRQLARSTAYFVPGHLIGANNRPNLLQTFGTTYLSFSRDGSELLASLHAEQVYLFNVREPQERYKSFDASLKPVLLDHHRRSDCSPTTDCGASATVDAEATQALPLDVSFELDNTKLPMEIFHQLNELILKLKSCPDLYRLRASALVNRGWRGDVYQALRDCCASLLLRPLDYKTLNQLAVILCRLGYRESAQGLLEYIETVQREFDAQDNDDLRQAVVLLKVFKSNAAADGGDLEPSSQLIRQLLGGTELSLDRLNSITANLGGGGKEQHRCSRAYDFSKRFCGHCNMNNDTKEAAFFGLDGEFIVAASDDGAFYVWDKATTNLVKAVQADRHLLNCVQPHPSICMLATCGVEPNVKLWSPQGKTGRDVKPLEARCVQNQEYISIDPLEAMVMMLYPDRDVQ